MEIQGFVQNYDWGKVGTTSKVATLHKSGESNFEIDDDTSYAELWMGTHPSGPSKIKPSGELLSAAIETNSIYLGEESVAKFGAELPFLFKVLSVRKALSIQAHPSKKHAEELHSKNPSNYKDSNHKPELAIALTPFKAMCGFRPYTEIKNFFTAVPELSDIIGDENISNFVQCNAENAEENLKLCFTAMMKCPEEKITEQLNILLNRFKNLDLVSRGQQLADVICTLHSQFPGDVGCFAPYFLNVVTLQPNEAIFLGPNNIHAYLQGDCIECMACSDNVVRAGLTPKFKDVDTLCEMLNYKGSPVSEQIFQPIVENQYSKLYKPPVPDFAVAKIEVASGVTNLELITRKTASILLCIEGDAKFGEISIKSGKILFVPANQKVEITNNKTALLMYQALTNI